MSRAYVNRGVGKTSQSGEKPGKEERATGREGRWKAMKREQHDRQAARGRGAEEARSQGTASS